MSQPITAGTRIVLRAVALLDVTEKERRLISFLSGQGRNGRWVAYSDHSLPRAIALEMGWNEAMVRRAMRLLWDRRWLAIGQDNKRRAMLFLTQPLVDHCEVLLDRQRVRRALGTGGCIWYQLTDELADEIAAKASTMYEPKRFGDRVLLVTKALTGITKEPRAVRRRPEPQHES